MVMTGMQSRLEDLDRLDRQPPGRRVQRPVPTLMLRCAGKPGRQSAALCPAAPDARPFSGTATPQALHAAECGKRLGMLSKRNGVLHGAVRRPDARHVRNRHTRRIPSRATLEGLGLLRVFQGTLDLLLAHPVPRARLILQRFGALMAGACGIAATVWIAMPAIQESADLTSISPAEFPAQCVNLALLAVAFGALAMGLGAATGRRAVVFAATAGIGVLTYAAHTFADQLGADNRTRRGASPAGTAGWGEGRRGRPRLLGGVRFFLCRWSCRCLRDRLPAGRAASASAHCHAVADRGGGERLGRSTVFTSVRAVAGARAADAHRAGRPERAGDPGGRDARPDPPAARGGCGRRRAGREGGAGRDVGAGPAPWRSAEGGPRFKVATLEAVEGAAHGGPWLGTRRPTGRPRPPTRCCPARWNCGRWRRWTGGCTKMRGMPVPAGRTVSRPARQARDHP